MVKMIHFQRQRNDIDSLTIQLQYKTEYIGFNVNHQLMAYIPKYDTTPIYTNDTTVYSEILALIIGCHLENSSSRNTLTSAVI